jgi:hypothetical protein
MTRSNITEIQVIYQRSTEKAICVSETEESKAIWLPLSQVEIEGDLIEGKDILVTGPEWLFIEKGLI